MKNNVTTLMAQVASAVRRGAAGDALRRALLVGGAALLSACGGSDSEPAGQQQAAPLASGATILQVGAGAVTTDVAQQARHAEAMRSLAPDAAVTPQAAAGVVTTYTPAQIRAAYGLPALPATTDLTGAQAVAQGAGQTIYIIDA